MSSQDSKPDLRTDPNLLNLMQKMVKRPLTPEEIRTQRISWCIGQTDAPRGAVERIIANG